MSVQRWNERRRIGTWSALAGLVLWASACSDATGTPGPATQITLNAGDAQAVAAGGAVATPPSVRVTDASGRGVNGVTVTFAVGSGGGTITGATPTTSGDGVAAVGSWTLGGAPGENTLTATAAGLTGSPVTFTATGAGVAFRVANGVATGTGASVVLPAVSIAGANRLLMCVLSVEPFDSPIVATSIALDDGAGGGAQALAALGTHYNAPSDGRHWVTYSLVAPTVGTRRLIATLSASANWTVACASYTGVDQVAPFGIATTSAGSAGSASLTVTSNAAGSLPWAHLFSTNSGFAAGVGATSRQATATGAFSAMVDGDVRIGVAGSHTFNWTYAGQYGGQAVMLRPAAVP